jgi:hypothetical protein
MLRHSGSFSRYYVECLMNMSLQDRFPRDSVAPYSRFAIRQLFPIR